jgi:hypothetical protein
MSRSDSKIIRQMLLWGFPLGTLAATCFNWLVIQRTGFAFPLYLLTVPYIFALVVVRLLTGPLRLWSWKVPLFHLAFLWSTYSALGILFVSDTIAAPFSVMSTIKTAVLCALLGGLVGTLVDIVGIDEGLLEIYYCSMDRGNVKTVLSYSFKFFGSFSAIYGIAVKVAHFFLVERGATQWLPVLIIGTCAILCLPFMAHFLLGDREPLLDASVPPTSEPPVP